MESNNSTLSEQTQGTAATQSNLKVEGRKDVIDIGGILRNYLKHWWLFALSLIVCVGGAAFYVYKKSPVYLVNGMIMVNQQEDGGLGQAGAMSALMSSMGFGSTTGANPENEQMKMTSHTMFTELADVLGLRYSYWQDNGFFKPRENYYKDAPIQIETAPAILDTISSSTIFKLEGPAKGPWRLTAKQSKKMVIDTEIKSLPYNAKTPLATFRISATKDFPKTGDLNVSAIAMSTDVTVDYLNENLGVNYLSNKADALQIGMEDAVVPRAKDIVNTLMDLYNQHRDEDRVAYNQMVLDFIDNRLLTLYHELESSESKIEKFKQNHKIVNAEAEAEYIFARKGAMDESAVKLQTTIQIYEMIQRMLSSESTKYSLIPFSGGGTLGLGDGYLKLIESYNDLVMERMNLAGSAKGNNSVLSKLDERIEALRNNILSSVSRELQSARINLQAVDAENSRGNARMSEIPSMEHELITLYRDREVQNQIYGFLLQKREETQIALSQSQPVGKIIDRAYAQIKPVAPKSMLCYAVGLVLGLGIPMVFLQLRRRKH